MKGLISDRPFNIGDRCDFDIVENTERLNQLPRLQNSRVFCSQGKASLQFSLGWFALSSSAKPRFDRLKRELLEVYNIILKFHEVYTTLFFTRIFVSTNLAWTMESVFLDIRTRSSFANASLVTRENAAKQVIMWPANADISSPVFAWLHHKEYFSGRNKLEIRPRKLFSHTRNRQLVN